MSDDEARLVLTRIKGIGSWSADVYLLMAMRRADIWPAGDLALAVAMKDLKGLAAPTWAGRTRTPRGELASSSCRRRTNVVAVLSREEIRKDEILYNPVENYFAIVEAVVVVCGGMLTCGRLGNVLHRHLDQIINHGRQIIRLAIDLQLPIGRRAAFENRVNVFDLFSRS